MNAHMITNDILAAADAALTAAETAYAAAAAASDALRGPEHMRQENGGAAYLISDAARAAAWAADDADEARWAAWCLRAALRGEDPLDNVPELYYEANAAYEARMARNDQEDEAADDEEDEGDIPA
jgi:hypothetical protein